MAVLSGVRLVVLALRAYMGLSRCNVGAYRDARPSRIHGPIPYVHLNMHLSTSLHPPPFSVQTHATTSRHGATFPFLRFSIHTHAFFHSRIPSPFPFTHPLPVPFTCTPRSADTRRAKSTCACTLRIAHHILHIRNRGLTTRLFPRPFLTTRPILSSLVAPHRCACVRVSCACVKCACGCVFGGRMR